MGISISRFYFEYPVTQFQNGDIECTTPEAEYCDFLILGLFIQTICQSGSCRFIDDTFYSQTCNFSCFFRCLALCIVEISRNGDDCFRYFLTQIIFCRFLHFLQNHGRNFLWRILTIVDHYPGSIVVTSHHFISYSFDFVLYLIETFTHETFDRVYRFFRIGDSLTFGRITYFPFAVVYKSYN